MAQPTILVVDDEALIRWTLRESLQQAGYRVAEAGSGSEALEKFGDGTDLVLLDYRLPDLDGLALLKRFKEIDPDILVILLTAHSSVDMAVAAMKEGAFHYANKPFDVNELLLLIEKALETTALRRELKTLRARTAEPHGFDRIIGDSPAMRSAKALMEKIAASPASTVLLTGESGTGKDLAAKVIHFNSQRAARPFMNITCSALTETLLESELFGHERGAFTDARQQKKGLLEQADGRTVFLDEIGEMVPALQAKVLRFLEEKAFKRVGGVTDITVDVRVIAATNRELEEAVRQGQFREDLYYRLNVLPIRLPPLRERGDDVLQLTRFYVDVFKREFRKGIRGISPEASAALKSYHWPGNVRELRNVVERAMLLADRDVLTSEHFQIQPRTALATGFRLPAGGVDLEELERDLVVQALERAAGNQTRAAALLGMNRDQMRYRIEKFKLAR
jgi:two-component system, NtrC family, response regulator AtoC